jgi:hypothetical protein
MQKSTQKTTKNYLRTNFDAARCPTQSAPSDIHLDLRRVSMQIDQPPQKPWTIASSAG